MLQRTCLGDRSAKKWEADGTWFGHVFFVGQKTFVGTPLLDDCKWMTSKKLIQHSGDL